MDSVRTHCILQCVKPAAPAGQAARAEPVFGRSYPKLAGMLEARERRLSVAMG